MSILKKITTAESIYHISQEELALFESIGAGKVREDDTMIEIHLSKSDKTKIIDYLTIGAGGTNTIEKISYSKN